MERTLTVTAQSFPIAGTFKISRGAKTSAEVVLVEINEDGLIGRGECVPYGHYGETVDGVLSRIDALRGPIEAGLNREQLQMALPAGAARNAIDCALWDLEAKQAGKSVANLIGMPGLKPMVTAFTLSLATPMQLEAAAIKARRYPLLKVKLGGDGDDLRIAAVRNAAPGARLIVDANESWTDANIAPNMAACRQAGVELIEQPLPAGADALLGEITHYAPICADESAHDSGQIEALIGRYDAINIKLDKAGGLTEALTTVERAKQAGLKIMVGCMLATSLSMAPAMVIAQQADFVDLDGPLLLVRDRRPGLAYNDGIVQPPGPELWG